MVSHQQDHRDHGRRAGQANFLRKLILLVEDDEANASLIIQVIEQETAHQVAYTRDGITAWKFLQHVKPQLVILGYRLPGIDGIQLYDRIRGSPTLHNVPVLLISAALPVYEIAQRGIVSLEKPFDLDTLLHTIDALLA
jgi:two-component system, response regulator, stage 0 sporulation protein F